MVTNRPAGYDRGQDDVSQDKNQMLETLQGRGVYPKSS